MGHEIRKLLYIHMPIEIFVGVTVGKKEKNQMSDYEPDIDEVS